MQENPVPNGIALGTALGTAVHIHLGERSYPITIGTGLLGDAATYQHLPAASCALIVCNTTVAPLYAAQLQAALQTRYDKVLLVTLPDGEVHKDWPTLQLIFDVLLQNTCDRKTVLFALGGGVVGDMTGFAAPATCAACLLCRCRPRCWHRLIPPWAGKLPSIIRLVKT